MQTGGHPMTPNEAAHIAKRDAILARRQIDRQSRGSDR